MSGQDALASRHGASGTQGRRLHGGLRAHRSRGANAASSGAERWCCAGLLAIALLGPG
jgi:hypothetical protein